MLLISRCVCVFGNQWCSFGRRVACRLLSGQCQLRRCFSERCRRLYQKFNSIQSKLHWIQSRYIFETTYNTMIYIHNGLPGNISMNGFTLLTSLEYMNTYCEYSLVFNGKSNVTYCSFTFIMFDDLTALLVCNSKYQNLSPL